MLRHLCDSKDYMSKQSFYGPDFSVQAGEPLVLPGIVTVAQLPTDGVAALQDTIGYVAPADIALPDLRVGERRVAGRKDDGGKVRMELLMDLSRAYEGVGQVLTWAVTDKKPVPYEAGSWQEVPDFHNRYMGALMRHLNNIHRNGRFAVDKETGILDLKHLATDAFFLAEMAQRELDKLQSIADSASVPDRTDNPVNQA